MDNPQAATPARTTEQLARTEAAIACNFDKKKPPKWRLPVISVFAAQMHQNPSAH